MQVTEPDPCPLCGRPNYMPTDHHLVPKSRGGKATATICASCHSAVHKTFTNKELASAYSTVDALLAHPVFSRTVAFIAKQDPRTKVRTDHVRTKWGRGGRFRP